MLKKMILLLFVSALAITCQAQQISKWKITDVLHYFNKNNDTTYVVNFWATFCKPCVGEIPYFISITNKYKDQKVKLLLVSLDLPDYYPSRIAAFAKKNNINARIVWLDETNADIFCPAIDNKWSGAIPATLVINNRTGFRKFVEDDIKAEDFEGIIKQALVKPNPLAQMTDHSFDPINEPE